MQALWCDEAGQTGNRLVNDNGAQPHFVYAAVAIDKSEAMEIIDKATKDFRLQGEMKVVDKVKHSNGQKAISWILETCASNARITIHHKMYSLGCKFFEQMIEPIISEESGYLYQADFHKFISHVLYRALASRHEDAEILLLEFQRLFMTDKKVEALASYLDGLNVKNLGNADLRNITSLVIGNAQSISDDLSMLADIELGRWALDHTLTSLHSVLCYWGQRYDLLDVYYDESKPLTENQETLELLVGLPASGITTLFGRAMAFNVNAFHPTSSKKEAGIQIAEVFAGAPAFALKNRDAEFSKKWIDLVGPCCLEDDCVAPDPYWSRPTDHSLYCSAILAELCIRTRTRADLFPRLQVAAQSRFKAMQHFMPAAGGARKTGKNRNRPCPCGSEIKFKFCHGA